MQSREFLVLEMRHEDGMQMEVGYAHITVHEDLTVTVQDIFATERGIDRETLSKLIEGKDIITKSSGTLYKLIEKVIPGFSSSTKNCGKIIGITRAYTPRQTNPKAKLWLKDFNTIRKELAITFDDVDTFRKNMTHKVASMAISDSTIFTILVVEKDLNKKYVLYNKDVPPPKTKE